MKVESSSTRLRLVESPNKVILMTNPSIQTCFGVIIDLPYLPNPEVLGLDGEIKQRSVIVEAGQALPGYTSLVDMFDCHIEHARIALKVSGERGLANFQRNSNINLFTSSSESDIPRSQ